MLRQLSLLFILFNDKYQKCSEIVKNNKAIKYWPFVDDMWNPNDNLRSAKRVFGRLGHEMVNGSHEEWDVLVSIEYIFEHFPDQMRNLKPHQRVNHFPGINYITYKAYMTTHNFYSFIPATFSFPDMVEDFKSFVVKNPKKKFVRKSDSNRGVEIVSKDKINFKKNDNKIYQEFIENPLLVDGHAFDLGVYVLITSIDPLRIYRLV